MDKKKFHYKLWQINPARDEQRVRFVSLDGLVRLTGSRTVDLSKYDVVFEGEQLAEEADFPENLFCQFNRGDVTTGYSGRSMSVSDVVEVVEGPACGFYYCDTVGFKKVDILPSDGQSQEPADMLHVVLLKPFEAAAEAWIGKTLEGLQTAVGGYFEVALYQEDGTAYICNEEGKILGMQGNRCICTEVKPGGVLRCVDISAGPCFICNVADGEFSSLSDEQISSLLEKYKDPATPIIMD